MDLFAWGRRKRPELRQEPPVIIVGNGVAGVTAALTLREKDAGVPIVLISDESPRFFARTALMYACMDKLTRRELEPWEPSFWEERQIALHQGRVVDFDADHKTVRLASGEERTWQALVLALGAGPRMPAWPSLRPGLSGVHTFVTLQDLDRLEADLGHSQRAVVVGGGLIGIELVECAVWAGLQTTFLLRDPWFWPMGLGEAEGALVQETLRRHGVDVRAQASVEDLCVEGDVAVGVRLQDGESLRADWVGIAIGVTPRLEMVQGATTPPTLGRGIRVNAHLQTDLPDVWACGDCAEIQVSEETTLHETLWYSAKRQGEVVGAGLSGESVRYTPPTFFNSSRFLDLDYTTAGDTLREGAGLPSLLRQHPERPVLQRIVHDGERVRGFHMLGSRWDHEVLCRWIEEARPLAWVREHLSEACYDEEFGRADLQACRESEEVLP